MKWFGGENFIICRKWPMGIPMNCLWQSSNMFSKIAFHFCHCAQWLKIIPIHIDSNLPTRSQHWVGVWGGLCRICTFLRMIDDVLYIYMNVWIHEYMNIYIYIFADICCRCTPNHPIGPWIIPLYNKSSWHFEVETLPDALERSIESIVGCQNPERLSWDLCGPQKIRRKYLETMIDSIK